MNAVIEENKTETETETETGLAVVEPKSLNEILSISDECPADFYKNPAYLEQVKTAKELAKTLVHNIDEQGRADSKKDSAAIRKYVKTIDGFRLNVFRSVTSKVQSWCDSLTAETKELKSIADEIDAKFKKMEQEKLDSIAAMLADELIEARNKLVIKPEFWSSPDLKPMIKLTTLTGTGNLTSKAKEFIKAIADGELVQQTKIEARVMTLENRCLRADINPPLTAISLGNDLYGTDEEFNAKVDKLISAEIERKAEMEERIKKQLAQENQQKLDAAMAGQQQQALETVRKEQAEQPIETKSTAVYPDVSKSVKAAEYEQPKAVERIVEPPVDNKKTVTVTAQFRIKVRKHISAQAVADHLRSKLPAEVLEVMTVCVGQEND